MSDQPMSFSTTDMDSNDALFVSVRRVGSLVYLGLSLRDAGDVEVGLAEPDTRRLIALLTQALASEPGGGGKAHANGAVP